MVERMIVNSINLEIAPKIRITFESEFIFKFHTDFLYICFCIVIVKFYVTKIIIIKFFVSIKVDKQYDLGVLYAKNMYSL